MSDIAERLRSTSQVLRTRPTPLSDVIPLLQQAADALDAQQAEMMQLTVKLQQSEEDVADMMMIAYLDGASKQERKIRLLKEEVRKNRKLICNIYNSVEQEMGVKALIECETGQWFVSGTDQTTYPSDM